MKNLIFFIGLSMLLFNSCIADDIIEDLIDSVVRITNPIDTIELNSTYQFEASYFNNVGKEEANTLTWASSDESKIMISSDGLATALESGDAVISVETLSVDGELVRDEIMVNVGNSTVVSNPERTGTLQTTSTYALKGDFILKEEGGNLVLNFASNYSASTALPGLYVYLTNNPNTISGAFEIGKVTNFSGAHSYSLPNSVGIMDYEYVLYFCKPFNVKVGDGELSN